jgi:hypothetical protein
MHLTDKLVGLQKIFILLKFGIRFSRSFQWALPEFAETWKQILLNPEFAETHGQLIWKTRNKKVYSVNLPEHDVYPVFALKTCDGVKPLRYLFRCSKGTLEGVNLKLMEQLGFPMVRLLAIADKRCFFYLKKTYLVTEFAVGFRDGRDFMPKGIYREDQHLKQLFVQDNLKLLAKLHQYHCYHKGFQPYNLLWKYDQDSGEFHTRWLDVASCRFMLLPEKMFHRYIIKDLAEFFYRMAFDETEMQQWSEYYLQFNPDCKLSFTKMLPGLRKGQKPH